MLFFESATCLKLIAPSPRSKNLPKNTNAPQVKDWPRWPPHPASAFSRDRGRGPRRFEGTFTFYSFLAEKVKFSKTVGQISLKFCQLPWNFLRKDENSCDVFPKKHYVWYFWGENGREMSFFHVFWLFGPITRFWLRKWVILIGNGWK